MTREEAIKILKARPYSGEVLEALETLVPEYNESENEKIRKALLDYFSCTGDDNLMLNGVYVKDIIAYLDKMKEKEWSEEDEKMLLSIINAFRNGAVSTIGQEQWLKSLPERFNLQPKQEWSKKDEKMLAVISYKISQHQGNDDRSLFTPDEAEFICGMEDKFKSLLEKVKNNQPSIENEKASEENILDKPNNVKDVKFPFKAKVKANNKTVIISFGRLNKDRNQWIMYTSDYTNNFKEYMPKELELIKNE